MEALALTFDFAAAMIRAASVDNLRKELECGVCYEDDVPLRLIPDCQHTFCHMCIGKWLMCFVFSLGNSVRYKSYRSSTYPKGEGDLILASAKFWLAKE